MLSSPLQKADTFGIPICIGIQNFYFRHCDLPLVLELLENGRLVIIRKPFTAALFLFSPNTPATASITVSAVLNAAL